MAGHGLPRSIPDVYERLDALEEGGGSGSEVAWDDVTGKPETFPATPASATAAVAAKTQIAALTAIADPATADTEACATAINAIIAALKA